MARHWPEIGVGWNVVSATMLGLLKEFGGPRQVARKPEKAAKRMEQIGGYFLAEDRIQPVLAWAASTVGQPMITEEERMLAEGAEDTDRIRRQQNRLENRIRRLIQSDERYEDVQRLAEEVGHATAALWRVQIGDFRDDDKPGNRVKAFGWNRKEQSSGQMQGALRISKRGPSEARRFLYRATLRKIRRDEMFRAKHPKKVKTDGGEGALKSVVALMRTYGKGLWHVPRGRRFDSEKLFDGSRLPAV